MAPLVVFSTRPAGSAGFTAKAVADAASFVRALRSGRSVIVHTARGLVKAHAAIPVPQGTRQGGRRHRPAPARVDHHEVVAQPMHLEKGQAVCSYLRVHAGHIRL